MAQDAIKREDQGFYILSESWYAGSSSRRDEYVEEINFGDFPNSGDDGTGGEMAMVWMVLGDKLVPQLQCFDDGWHVLASYGDVIARLGQVDGDNISPQDFAQLLVECGFKDLTQRKDPYKSDKKDGAERRCPCCGQNRNA